MTIWTVAPGNSTGHYAGGKGIPSVGRGNRLDRSINSSRDGGSASFEALSGPLGPRVEHSREADSFAEPGKTERPTGEAYENPGGRCRPVPQGSSFWCGYCGWSVEYNDGQWNHCEPAFFGHQALPCADHDYHPPGCGRRDPDDFKPVSAVTWPPCGEPL